VINGIKSSIDLDIHVSGNPLLNVTYIPVGTSAQDLTIQQEALKAAGCEIVRCEKVSGSSVQGRDELNNLLDFIREGDELIVTRIDRLARSIRDLQNIVHSLTEKGVVLRATEQAVDTATAAGKCFLDMLGVFAEFETNLRKERQMEGIAKAKERGVYRGRKATIDVEKVRELKESGMSPTKIAKEMGIGRASVYRVLEPS
jgi:DNA invertase Pin-like site-specific DNA recombinase